MFVYNIFMEVFQSCHSPSSQPGGAATFVRGVEVDKWTGFFIVGMDAQG